MKIEDRILQIVSSYMDISISEMKGRTRMRKAVEARQAFFYIYYNLIPITYRELGYILNRDHATVIYSIKTVENIISVYQDKNTDIKNMMDLAKKEVNIFASDIIMPDDIFLENDFYVIKSC